MQLKEAAILIVEDEPMLLEITAEWFQDLAGKVLTATNGAEALALMERERVNAILTDVRMPVMDGVALLKAIKSMGTYTPGVIFVSGFSDVGPREALALGAEATMSKPVNRKELIQTVQRILTDKLELWSQPDDKEPGVPLKQTLSSASQAISSGEISFGRGGFCLQTARGLSTSRLNLNLEFTADSKILAGTGIVRWEDPRDMKAGIEIMHLEESCRRWVYELTQRHGNGAFIPGDTVRTL